MLRIIILIFATSLYGADQAVKNALATCQEKNGFADYKKTFDTLSAAINENYFDFLGAVRLSLAVLSKPTVDGNKKQVAIDYSFPALQVGTEYRCPVYNLDGLAIDTSKFSPDSVINNGLISQTGNTCNINCGSKACSANNNLYYQINDIDNNFSNNFPNSLCDESMNTYFPSCTCAAPGLSLSYINQHNGCVWGGGCQQAFAMQCPMCKYYYLATNALVVSKYKTLLFIFDTLKDSFVQKQLMAYCKQKSLSPSDATLCQNYLIFSKPLLPTVSTISVEWCYMPNLNNSNFNNGCTSTHVDAAPTDFCLLVDLNKLYQVGDVFNYISFILNALKFGAESLKSEVMACLSASGKIAAASSSIANNSYIEEKLAIENQEAALQPLKNANSKFELANNIMSVPMILDFVMGGKISHSIQKLGSALKEVISGAVNTGATRLESMVENKIFSGIKTKFGFTQDALEKPVNTTLKDVSTSVDGYKSAETVGGETLSETEARTMEGDVAANIKSDISALEALEDVAGVV